MRILVLVLLLVLAGCSQQDTSVKAASTVAGRQSAAEYHEQGRRIYNFRCYFCHGYSGDARTLASTYLSPKPRDFTGAAPEQLSRDNMLATVEHGRPGTAMKGFSGILNSAEIAAVTDFVRQEFMVNKAHNTHYHTAENGWPDHDRHAAAFPFATGKIPLDTPLDNLTPTQKAGRQLFLTTCVSCHDRAQVNEPGANWELRPLSYPRNGHEPGDGYAPGKELKLDGMASASPYLLHDRPPVLTRPSAQEKRGEALFQNNCAFCHAADGTGRNWIGSFMEPHPRDLTNPEFMSAMTRKRMAGVIRDGLPGTSMPAWKSVLSEPDIRSLIAYISRAFHPVSD